MKKLIILIILVLEAILLSVGIKKAFDISLKSKINTSDASDVINSENGENNDENTIYENIEE